MVGHIHTMDVIRRCQILVIHIMGYDRYNRGYKYALSGIKDSWPTSDIDVV